MRLTRHDGQARRTRHPHPGRALALGAVLALMLGGADTSFAGCSEDDDKDEEWSIYISCNKQFNDDRKICRKVRRAICWKSQMDRLAWCNKNKGETGFPPLQID